MNIYQITKMALKRIIENMHILNSDQRHLKRRWKLWSKKRKPLHFLSLTPVFIFLSICLITEFPILLVAYLSTKAYFDKSLKLANIAKSTEIIIFILLFFACWIIEGCLEIHYRHKMIIYNVALNTNYLIKYEKLLNNLTSFYNSLAICHLEILAFVLSEMYVTNIMPIFNALLDLMIILASFSIFIVYSQSHLYSLKTSNEYVNNRSWS